MEKEIIEEIMKGKKWYQKIVIRMFKNTVVAIYRKGMVDSFNYFNK